MRENAIRHIVLQRGALEHARTSAPHARRHSFLNKYHGL
jgi:hypothetical protein